MPLRDLPKAPTSSKVQSQQCKACFASQKAHVVDNTPAGVFVSSTQKQLPSGMVSGVEYSASDAPEILNRVASRPETRETFEVMDSPPVKSKKSVRRNVRTDMKNRPGCKLTRPIHVPSHKMLTGGFYYFPGLMYHGITEDMWKSMIKEMLSGINPHKDAWITFLLVLFLPPLGVLTGYGIKKLALEKQFREQLHDIRNIIARWDAETFRHRGLMIRLEMKSDVRTLATADLYHRDHIDDMTPLLTSTVEGTYEHLREARHNNLGRARLVIAPLSYLKGLDKKNVWRLWDQEAAARRSGKFAHGDLPKGLTKERIATSRLWPDNETIPESIPWDQRKIAFAWRYKDADGVSVRRRVRDDSLYLAKIDVQRKKNEPIKALFKRLFPEGYIVPEDFPARARAAGRGNNPLGDSIFKSRGIEEVPRSHMVYNDIKFC